MKTTITFLLAVLLFGLTNAQIPTNGLVAWYPFNGNANDASGNGLNCMVYGATLTSDRFGNSNSAYHFDGNDYINALVGNIPSYSISFWVQDTTPMVSYPTFASYNSLYCNRMGYGTDLGKIYIRKQIANNNGYSLLTSTSYSFNSWRHIYFEYNDTTHLINLYIDGAYNCSSIYVNDGGFNATTVNNKLYFGARAFLYAWEYLTGNIDDIRFYSRSLNPSEILSLAAEGAAPPAILCDTVFIEQFTMSFGQAYSHYTPVTILNDSYFIEVTGTYGVANWVNHLDAAYEYSPPVIPLRYWKWNGLTTQRPSPDAYNPNHKYRFFYTGNGSTQAFTFTDNPYPDNTGSLLFKVYHIQNCDSCLTPIPLVANMSNCGPGIVTLTASGGTTYKWYNTPTGGSVVGTGATFTSPYLIQSDTFWVSNFDSCESARVPAVATIMTAHIAQNDTTICAGGTITLNITGATTPTPTNGMVAFYPFNGNANDESGNSNNGTVYGATLTTDRFGISNKAYSFNGSNYIHANDSPSLNWGNSAYSLVVWFNASSYQTFQHLISKNLGIMPYTGWLLRLANTNAYFESGATYSGSWLHNSILSSTSNVSLNTWHNIVAIYNPALNLTSIYLDGTLNGTTTAASIVNPNNSEGLNIGSEAQNSVSGPLYWYGKIDDVRIYNRALTSSEISVIYNEGSTSSNYTYIWSTGSTTAAIAVSPSQSITYFVTITNSGTSCIDSVHVSVTGSSISGKLTYDNAPISSPLSCSKVYLKTSTGTAVDSTDTDINGNYHFCGISNGSYTLSAKTTKAVGGINATDALLTAKHYVNIIILTGIKLAAADVNASGYVNSTDALIITKRYTQVIPTFVAGDWIFEQPAISFTSNSANVVNFKGLCFGDVNGSYTPPINPIANAGIDQLNLQGTTATLIANNPGNGETGTWSVLSGTGGVFSNFHAPNAIFTGQSGLAYTLIWTVSNPCSSSSTDTLLISFNTSIGQPCPGTPSFVYGGQTYNTIQIGTQC